MPTTWSPKDERQYGHILASCRKRGRYGAARCKSVAAATVNKQRGREGRSLSGLGATKRRRVYIPGQDPTPEEIRKYSKQALRRPKPPEYDEGVRIASSCLDRLLMNPEDATAPGWRPQWECLQYTKTGRLLGGGWKCAQYTRVKGRHLCVRQKWLTEGARLRHMKERGSFDEEEDGLDGFGGVASGAPLAFGTMGLVFLLSLYNKAQAALP